MVGILAFNLSDGDDNDKFDVVRKAEDYRNVLFDFDQWLRGQIKYADKEDLQSVRGQLHDICETFEVEI